MTYTIKYSDIYLTRTMSSWAGADLESPEHQIINTALTQFFANDWGTVHPEDAEANNEDLPTGGRALGAYKGGPTGTFWIIADPVNNPDDERVVTVLDPSDY